MEVLSAVLQGTRTIGAEPARQVPNACDTNVPFEASSTSSRVSARQGGAERRDPHGLGHTDAERRLERRRQFIAISVAPHVDLVELHLLLNRPALAADVERIGLFGWRIEIFAKIDARSGLARP